MWMNRGIPHSLAASTAFRVAVTCSRSNVIPRAGNSRMIPTRCTTAVVPWAAFSTDSRFVTSPKVIRPPFRMSSGMRLSDSGRTRSRGRKPRAIKARHTWVPT